MLQLFMILFGFLWDWMALHGQENSVGGKSVQLFGSKTLFKTAEFHEVLIVSGDEQEYK